MIKINTLKPKFLRKALGFTLLLITMGIVIPSIINAQNIQEIKILTVEKKIENTDEYSEKLCNEWNLTEENIKDYFETAESFVTGAEISYFDVYPCKVEGLLLMNDNVERKYSINLGGFAFIYGFGTELQGYGCMKSECLKYIHYEPYDDSED